MGFFQDIGDTLFGSTEVEQQSRLLPGQQSLLDQLSQFASQQFASQQLSSQQLSSQQQASQQGGVGQSAFARDRTGIGQFDAGSEAFGLGMGALRGAAADFDPASAQQFFQQSVIDPGRQQFQDLIGDISQRFAGQGAIRSGGFQRSLGRAATEFGTNQQAQLANLIFQSEQAQRNRQLQSGQVASQFARLPGQEARAEQTIGLQERGLGLQERGLGLHERGLGLQERGLGLHERGLGLHERGLEGQLLNQRLGLALGTPAFGEPIVTQTEGLFGSLAPALGSFLGTESGAGALAGFLL